MILGRIIGKTTPAHFSFQVEGEAKKFMYVQVMHAECDFVLCQIQELEKDAEKTIGKCIAIGYRDSEGHVKLPRSPFEPGTEVLLAEDSRIAQIIQSGQSGAYLGELEGRDIKVYLDLNKLLTKHLAVMAKSGAGKSYTVAVLLEEILEKKIPLVIIDPHGEYSFMAKPNDNPDDIKRMERFGIKPKGYANAIQEYADEKIVQGARMLRLNDNFTPEELFHILPAKISNTQRAILYSAIKNLETPALQSLIYELDQQESSQKNLLVSIISYLKGLDIFARDAMAYNELVQSGKASIINLKGIAPEVQEIIVFKILNDLFEERKKATIPPFFVVVEEAHNFVPERSFGETKCSRIIRTVASEGRKFGMGLCVVTQRPARIEKNVLSQCTTEIIMKVTNPNDLKAISQSVEGITLETEEEIKNLPIGVALVTGIVDIPLFVSVRPRKSKHGGDAVDMLRQDRDFIEEVKEYEEILPLLFPTITPKDIRLMHEGDGIVRTILIPAYLFQCKGETPFHLLVEMVDGKVVKDVEQMKSAMLPKLEELSQNELAALRAAYSLKRFTLDDFIIKAGTGLDAQKIIDSLIAKGYIEKAKDAYIISDGFVLSNLGKYAMFHKIEFRQLRFDEKRERRANLDKVKTHLAKFTDVVDQKECWIVHYDFIAKAM